MNSKYQRVIPRDLFNEAKLLKCLGQLVLLILDGHGMGIRCEHTHETTGFVIGIYDYALRVKNIKFYKNNIELIFETPYNNMVDSYPLKCIYKDTIYDVFESDAILFNYATGQDKFSLEFIELIESLNYKPT